MRAVNLLPKDAPRAVRQSRLPLLVTALGAIVLGVALGSLFLLERGKVTERRETLQSLRAQIEATPPPPVQEPTDPALAQQKRERLAAVSTALGERIAFDRLLRELSLVLPDDVWLTSLKATAPASPSESAAAGAAVPPATAPGTASGFAASGFTYSQEGVARLLARLSVVPDLANLQLQRSALSDTARRPVVEFTILGDLRRPGGAG